MEQADFEILIVNELINFKKLQKGVIFTIDLETCTIMWIKDLLIVCNAVSALGTTSVVGLRSVYLLLTFRFW